MLIAENDPFLPLLSPTILIRSCIVFGDGSINFPRPLYIMVVHRVRMHVPVCMQSSLYNVYPQRGYELSSTHCSLVHMMVVHSMAMHNLLCAVSFSLYHVCPLCIYELSCMHISFSLYYFCPQCGYALSSTQCSLVYMMVVHCVGTHNLVCTVSFSLYYGCPQREYA